MGDISPLSIATKLRLSKSKDKPMVTETAEVFRPLSKNESLVLCVIVALATMHCIHSPWGGRERGKVGCVLTAFAFSSSRHLRDFVNLQEWDVLEGDCLLPESSNELSLIGVQWFTPMRWYS